MIGSWHKGGTGIPSDSGCGLRGRWLHEMSRPVLVYENEVHRLEALCSGGDEILNAAAGPIAGTTLGKNSIGSSRRTSRQEPARSLIAM